MSDEAVGACPQPLTFLRPRTGAFIANVIDGAEIVVGDEDPESPTWIGGTQYEPSQCFTLPEATGP